MAATTAWQMCIRAVCAFALMFAAFAHRPVVSTAYGDTDLSAYVLPDGTLPGLCLPVEDGDGKQKGSSGSCEFCRIASSIALPEPPSVTAERCVSQIPVAVPMPVSEHIPSSGAPPSAPPRGPPVLLI